MPSTQIAVRMEPELLEKLDWLVVRCSFENRAEAIRSVIERVARVEREREIDEQIVAAYTRMPQTEEELAWSRKSDWSDLPDEDWSDWL